MAPKETGFLPARTRWLPDDVLGKVRAGIAGAEREPAPRDTDALELGVLDDRFELIEWLGDGGMGTVYRARDLQRASDVAVKVLHRCDLDGDTRFAREVAALAALSDPGIVAYIAHGETPSGDHYLVTELLHGETLAEHLLREGRMPLEEALALGRAAAHTLAVAHARGLVHRDVKPSNVFLRDVDRARREQPGDRADPGRIALLDFGLVRGATDFQTLTGAGVAVGTPGYMAPEQIRGAGRVGPQADVFALGCVLFECLTGRRAFGGSDAFAVMASILLGEPPLLGELITAPPALEDLLARMLAKDPAARPSDGAEVCDRLELVCEGREAKPPSNRRLGAGERRIGWIVVAVEALAHRALTQRPATAPAPPEEHEALRAEVRARVAAPGLRLETLGDGSLVALFVGDGEPRERAAAAARGALAMRALLPRAPLALAMGRVELGGASGQLAHSAARLARRAVTGGDVDRHGPPIIVDAESAELLSDTFRFERGDDHALLLGERADDRMLLGRRSPIVGRAEELGELERHLDAAARGTATSVLVSGFAGIGKSRIVQELVERRGQDVSILRARCEPLATGAPFHLVGQLIRQRAAISGSEPMDDKRARLVNLVARSRLDPSVAWFLGEVAGVPFPDDAALELVVARRDARLLGDRIQAAWLGWLSSESAPARTVLMVLEDLHWGDLASVRLVELALDRLPEMPLLVCALARPEVEQRFPVFRQRSQRLVIEPLPRSSSEAIAIAALGDRAGPSLVARLADHAMGNPFYLEQLVRAAAEGVEELPSSVVASVESRLSKLGEQERRVARAASIFGTSFTRDGIQALVPMPAVDLDGCLEGLRRAEVIARHPQDSSGGRALHAFQHAILRDVLYGTLTDADRSAGHRLAGEQLQEAGDAEPLVIAEHFERGGLEERAVVFYRRAAHAALAGNDLAGALACADAAVRCGASGISLAAVRLVQAESHWWQGANEQAFRCALEAIANAPRASSSWFAAVAMAANAGGPLGETERVEAFGRELLEQPWDAHTTPNQVVCATHVITQLMLGGARQTADTLLARLERADVPLLSQDPVAMGRVHHVRAARATVDGDPGGYRDHSIAARDAYARAGALRAVCMYGCWIGDASKEIGDYEGAEAMLRDAIATARALRIESAEAAARTNLGLVLARLGKLDEAVATAREALRSNEAQGHRRMAAAARAYLAVVLCHRGELAEAEQVAREAVAGSGAHLPFQGQAQATLAYVLLCAGRAADCLEACRGAMDLLERLGAIEEGESLARVTFAQALAAVGEVAAAREAIAAAEQRLRERAARIENHAHRTTFLERVPENARTLELARAWAAGPG